MRYRYEEIDSYIKEYGEFNGSITLLENGRVTFSKSYSGINDNYTKEEIVKSMGIYIKENFIEINKILTPEDYHNDGEDYYVFKDGLNILKNTFGIYKYYKIIETENNKAIYTIYPNESKELYIEGESLDLLGDITLGIEGSAIII